VVFCAQVSDRSLGTRVCGWYE